MLEKPSLADRRTEQNGWSVRVGKRGSERFSAKPGDERIARNTNNEAALVRSNGSVSAPNWKSCPRFSGLSASAPKNPIRSTFIQRNSRSWMMRLSP